MSEVIAKKIATMLKDAGFQALYAGGWVRDRLLAIQSNDIDIATDATPNEVAKLFPKAILVGAQFGVVRVIVEGHEYEIATFRVDDSYIDGRKPDSVHLVRSCKEDAQRRDFTINGMFYDPFTDETIDYVGGRADLEKNIIRAIGNALERFQEDRLRMIRAIRFAVTFNATIEENTWSAICAHASHLRPAVSTERIYQELQKIYTSPQKLVQALQLFQKCGLLQQIFPHGIEIDRVATVPQGTPLPLVLGSVELLRSFHASNEEIQMVLYLERVEKALTESHDDAFWADLYAHPLFDTTIALFNAPEHTARKKTLAWWIERKQKKNPLVTASDLLQRGYKPGKELGMLLQKAEALSINEKIQDKDEVLKRLI